MIAQDCILSRTHRLRELVQLQEVFRASFSPSWCLVDSIACVMSSRINICFASSALGSSRLIESANENACRYLRNTLLHSARLVQFSRLSAFTFVHFSQPQQQLSVCYLSMLLRPSLELTSVSLLIVVSRCLLSARLSTLLVCPQALGCCLYPASSRTGEKIVDGEKNGSPPGSSKLGVENRDFTRHETWMIRGNNRSCELSESQKILRCFAEN